MGVTSRQPELVRQVVGSRHAAQYEPCPECGGIKARISRRCWDCHSRRHGFQKRIPRSFRRLAPRSDRWAAFLERHPRIYEAIRASVLRRSGGSSLRSRGCVTYRLAR